MDVITGNGADGRLRGGGGDDVLAGGAGDQRVEGGAGATTSPAARAATRSRAGRAATCSTAATATTRATPAGATTSSGCSRGADAVTLGEGADALGIELAETGADDRHGIGATVVADFDPAEDRIGAGASGVDAAGERVEVDLFAGFLDSDGDGALSAADREVLGTGGGIVLDLGAALARALGRDDLAPRTQTVELPGVEELDLATSVAPLEEAYGGFAAAHEDLLRGRGRWRA
jgi:Ca2+-binding RTX toxin-like protein